MLGTGDDGDYEFNTKTRSSEDDTKKRHHAGTPAGRPAVGWRRGKGLVRTPQSENRRRSHRAFPSPPPTALRAVPARESFSEPGPTPFVSSSELRVFVLNLRAPSARRTYTGCNPRCDAQPGSWPFSSSLPAPRRRPSALQQHPRLRPHPAASRCRSLAPPTCTAPSSRTRGAAGSRFLRDTSRTCGRRGRRTTAASSSSTVAISFRGRSSRTSTKARLSSRPTTSSATPRRL